MLLRSSRYGFYFGTKVRPVDDEARWGWETIMFTIHNLQSLNIYVLTLRPLGPLLCPGRQSKQNALLPRKILSSVAAFASLAEISHGRSNLTLMLCLIPFKTTVPHNCFFSSAKQRYLVRGTPWQVCRQPIRLRIYRINSVTYIFEWFWLLLS